MLNGIAFVVAVAGLPVGGLGRAPVRAGAEDLAASVRVVNAEPDQQARDAGRPALAGAVPVQQGRQRNICGLLPDGVCRLAGRRCRVLRCVGSQERSDVGGVVISFAGIAE
ncbi:hypothetical protein D9M72_474780 [compost metagenome]